MIRVHSSGDFNRTRAFLHRLKSKEMYRDLNRFGKMGVDALAAATPRASGETANAWTYQIKHSRSGTTISWDNTNENDGQKVAILIQYGHGTGTGGYVVDKDFINPAMGPIFDKIAQEVWRKVTNG